MRDRDPNDDVASESERILRALAEQDQEGELPAPADERLLAYREGRLDADEEREMERILAQSAAGRRRLLALAGVDHSLPLRRVRKAVLAAAAGQRRRSPWLLSVAAVAAALVLAVIGLLPGRRGLPAGLAYDVAAHGLAEARSADQAASTVQAYPGTPLRISARPRGDSPSGITFALYRREGDALRRVRQPEEVRLVNDRGSASFSGAAAAILGTHSPGVYPLYVVASRHEPPSLVTVATGQQPATALGVPGRLVYPLTVTLLRDEPGTKEGTP